MSASEAVRAPAPLRDDRTAADTDVSCGYGVVSDDSGDLA